MKTTHGEFIRLLAEHCNFSFALESRLLRSPLEVQLLRRKNYKYLSRIYLQEEKNTANTQLSKYKHS